MTLLIGKWSIIVGDKIFDEDFVEQEGNRVEDTERIIELKLPLNSLSIAKLRAVEYASNADIKEAIFNWDGHLINLHIDDLISFQPFIRATDTMGVPGQSKVYLLKGEEHTL